jgi:hypothetical protein
MTEITETLLIVAVESGGAKLIRLVRIQYNYLTDSGHK